MKKSKIAVLVLSLGLLMGGISSLPQSPSFNFEKEIKRAGEVTKTGTINFGSEATDLNVDKASVSGKDDIGNTWGVETVGTTSFSPNPNYNQLGSSSKPATSITLTCDLGKKVKLTNFSIKFGGNRGTKGTVSIKIGDVKVGEGSIIASADVTISATDATKEGNVISVEVTDIDKGVKLYSLTYTYEEVDMSETEIAIQNISTNNTKAQLQYTFNAVNHSITQAFVEVTENLDDWSGTYLLGYKNATDVNIFKGKLDASHLDDTFNNVKNFETKLVDSNKIYYTDNLALNAVTIEKSTLTANTYTIKTAGGDYIGNDTGKNGLQSSKTITEDFESTIAYDATTKFVDIKIGTLSFKFNNSADQKRFRFYTTSSNISLFKLTDLATPVDTYKYTFSNMKMNFGAIIKKSILEDLSAKATITEYGIAVAQKSKIDADSKVSSITEALSAPEAKGYVTKKSQTYNSEALTLTDATGTADTGDYVIFSANLNYPEGTTKYTDVVDAVAYFVVDGSYVVLKEKSCSVSSLADEYVASEAFSSFTVYAQESLMALGALND